MTTTFDNDCQIRVRRRTDNDGFEFGVPYFQVTLGFWVERAKRRVWFLERDGYIGCFKTRAEATVAATDPALRARRDTIRAARGNPPVKG